MISLTFSDQDLTNLQEACEDSSLPEKIKRKLMCLRMHQQQVRHGVIAKILSISNNTVALYLKEYRDEGLTATLEDCAYRPSSCLEPFLDCVKCSFSAWPPQDVSDAMRRIVILTGVSLSESQVRKSLHKMGFKYRKTGVIPGKADTQLQLDFYDQELSPRLVEAAKNERKVFFVDAAHFVLGSFLGMIWCLKRIFIRSGAGRQRYNVLGALDSHSKEVITVRSTDNVNAITVCELIDQIREIHDTGPVTLVMDNARYQRCKK